MLKKITESIKPFLIIGGISIASAITYFWFKSKIRKKNLRNSLKGKTTFTKKDVLNVYTRYRRNKYPLLEMLLNQHNAMEAQLKHDGITLSA